MRLTVNGEDLKLDKGSTLKDLLQSLGLDARLVAVEVNREIVSGRDPALVPLAEGDTVEIVHFVGGGA